MTISQEMLEISPLGMSLKIINSRLLHYLSGANELNDFQLTSKYIILVVLVSLGTHFDKTLKAIVTDELMHQVFVILK